MIVEIRRQVGATLPGGGEQAAFAPQVSAQKSTAAVAASAKSGPFSTRAAIARPLIMSAFQAVRIFSSRAGRMRVSRT